MRATLFMNAFSRSEYMKLLLALVVLGFVAAPIIFVVIAPYLHCRANQKFEQWMRRAGITREMLTLAEKAVSKDEG